jgi:hypothetical protein
MTTSYAVDDFFISIALGFLFQAIAPTFSTNFLVAATPS